MTAYFGSYYHVDNDITSTSTDPHITQACFDRFSPSVVPAEIPFRSEK